MPQRDAVDARARPTLFFIAAAIHAAVAVPLWVVSYAGPRETGLSSAWHGGEMIFGYAYAVFGGFFLTRASGRFFLSLLAIWLASRILALTPDRASPAAATLAVVYPLLLFGYAAWPFLRAVKRWRNAVFAPVLAALFAASALHGLATLDMAPAGRGALLAFDLIIVMLFVMGGRFAAAAASGAAQRRGERLRKPAHPGLERAGLACLAAAAASDVVAPHGPAAAAFAAPAMTVAFIRLWLWRPWRMRSHPEVAFLLLGYFWLGAGLGARAVAGFGDMIPPVEADHVLAVGALGTLSMTVMARVARQRSGHPVEFGAPLVAALSLVSAATVLRLIAAFGISRDAALTGAGTCWSAAFLVFACDLVVVWRGARRPG